MIGKIIQNKRKEVGLTQAQLADRLGVTAPAVNRWEKNLSFPDATLLAPLARCLKIDLNELFSFYDSLSDRERELIVDTVKCMFIENTDEETLAYIRENIRQNLSDGELHFKIAEAMYGMHLLKKTVKPGIYLEYILEYYERALELLPEKKQSISETLMSIYASMGDKEKANYYWSQLCGTPLDCMQAHANMLFLLKDYTAAASEMKGLVLRKVINLLNDLDLLGDTLLASGDAELSKVAKEKATEMRKIFDLWEGFDILSLAMGAMTEIDAEAQIEHLTNLFVSDPRGKKISESSLFDGVELGNKENDERTIADGMADLMNALKKLKR